MSLSRKERDQLAEVIQRENEMVLKVGRMVRNAFILTLAFGAVTYWGWSGMTDPMFPNIPMSVRNVAKWIPAWQNTPVPRTWSSTFPTTPAWGSW